MLKMYGMAMEALNLDQRPTEDVAAGAGGDLMGGADGPAAEAAAEAAAIEGAHRDLLTYNGCPTPPPHPHILSTLTTCRLVAGHNRHGTHADARRTSSVRSQRPTP